MLQLHAADLGLELFGELGGDLLLADQVDDDSQHEVDQVDGTLNDVFLGLRQALGWVPSSALQEEVVNPAVQLAVELAKVLATVALGDAVFLALIIWVGRDGASLALTPAELLERRLAVDILRCDQRHDLGLGEIGGPFGGKSLLRCKCLLPGAFRRVGRRGGGNDLVIARPRGLELARLLGSRGAGSKGILVLERIEGTTRQRVHSRERRQAAVLTQIGVGHGSRFQRTRYVRMVN